MRKKRRRNRFVKLKLFILLILLLALTGFIIYRLMTEEIPEIQQEVPVEEEAAFFDGFNVKTINIELSEPDYQEMFSKSSMKDYKPAEITIDEVTIENSAICIKSSSTISNSYSEQDVYSFMIDFKKYVPERMFGQTDSIILNSCFADISYMREYTTYEAMSEIGGVVPFVTFAELYINDQYFGLYSCTEAIDSNFLERNFRDSGGNLYKTSNGADLLYKEELHYPYAVLQRGSDQLMNGLKGLIKKLETFESVEELEEVLDIDSVLRYAALNVVTSNYASYSGPFSSNYYLYELNGKFYILLCDAGSSIDAFTPRTIRSDENLIDYLVKSNTLTIPIDEPVFQIKMEDRPLIDKLLKIPEYKQRYYLYIYGLIEYYGRFEEHTKAIAAVIRPYIKKSDEKSNRLLLFDRSISPDYYPQVFNSRQYYSSYVVNSKSIVNYMNKRVDIIKRQLAGELPKTGNLTFDNYSKIPLKLN